MNVLILMGSPRTHGNTAELCKPFLQKLKAQGADVRYVALEKLDIRPCRGCYACQDVAGEYGCVQKDDMEAVAAHILWAHVIILATPIYTWYCPAKMKAVLDRFYGFNKYYGSSRSSLWEGKKVGILATHGYEDAYATEPFVMGVQRLCIHSNLNYIGIYSVQDKDDLSSFQTAEAIQGAEKFALGICSGDNVNIKK